MTEPLRPADPSALGGHRLLGRLGAGGMGVVYLGRTGAGALAAVKMIQADLADDPEFRARFRREVQHARRVTSAWAVPVTGADTEAPRPWMATAFVPGPSLAEAVTRCGPLPPRAVLILARMLARALTAVHAAGLVHRDVKPQNVLLGPDGPRLIDFGIARPAEGATTLTGEGMVLGTPGFLAPEQAEGRTGATGPAADVFSLGCLLAYAATGRPPFGTGTPDALLYRTVHDEPDLSGLDGAEHAPLAALLRRCLAKDPAARPAPEALDAEITEDVPDGSVSWLPDDVVRLMAVRAAELLALPDIEPTEIGTPAGPARPGRRRLLTLAAGGAVALAGGAGALWALSGSGDGNSDGAGNGDGGPDPAAGGSGSGGPRIAVHADLSGPGRAAGQAQERGVRLAVEEFNARPDAPFTLSLVVEDDGGDPQRAAEAAARLAGDPAVLAVIGPTHDATALTALPRYEEAQLAMVAVSPGRDTLAAEALVLEESLVLVRTRPSDIYLSVPLATLLLGSPAPGYPGVLQDRALGIQSQVTASLVHTLVRDSGGVTHPRVVPPGVLDNEGYGTVVAEMLAAGIDALVYAGPADGAAAVARELAAAGFTGPRYGIQPVLDPVFPERAGEAAEGWTLVSSFTDPVALPAAGDFVAAHRKAHGEEPGPWAAEAYDAATLVVRALGSAPGGPPDRAELAPMLREATLEGIAKSYAFSPDGSFAGEGTFLYRVENGGFTFLGPAAAPA
ncbi:bifunctional serine/threonine-protein kinase/ABC transporter substrate-binding protein [Streptomyces aidingensis]|uniref:Serine/threonine protein kinase n=1 Tax=Streptomyces aidingensis TaxID=910347 RepID=A0A1I1JDH2_9ACTN|nr:bifunctional serine/threonine-protein kinase/ABC transporter substrate-binding protein [Streptomyces aidingensis]SFC43490.1 Serine/threonine protein kinase [Streptomyces aidingensis]